MNKHFLYVLAILALVGLGIGQHLSRQALEKQHKVQAAQAIMKEKKLKDEIQRIRQDSEAAKARAGEELASLQERLDRQTREINRLKSAAAEAREAEQARERREKALAELDGQSRKTAALKSEASGEPAPSSEDKAASSTSAQPMFKGLSKMMKNPMMRQMALAQQKGLMEEMNKSFYAALNLPEDKLAQLKELLYDKQGKQMDIGLELMDSSMTPEERKQKAADMEKIKKESDAKIKELLGEEKFELYQSHEETQAEQMQVHMFDQALGAGNGLTEDQEADLIMAMHEERTNLPTKLPDGKTVDPSQFTPENMNKMMESMKQLNQQYITRAAKILNEEQMAKFKAYMEQQQSMQEMGMKMAVKMFGGEEKK